MLVKMAASDDDSRSEVSEILASCDNTSPKKKEPDMDQNSETSSDPFEVIITLQPDSLSTGTSPGLFALPRDRILN